MAKKSKGESKKESGLYKDEESRKRAMDEIRLKEIV